VSTRPNVRAFLHEHRDQLFADLAEWVGIPSISASSDHYVDVVRSAEWLAGACRAAGFPSVEIWRTAGLPAVFAEWPSDEPDAPTVLVYGHHDVQPVDDEAWTTPPFQLVADGDALRGRGTSDDKGQVLFHLLGLRAHLAATGRSAPAVTLKLLIEGEEESGSPSLAQLLAENAARLRSDVIVVTDTEMIGEATPSTVIGMRGIVVCRVEFRGVGEDLHSGKFGGTVPNAAAAMARTVAALHDDAGRVRVPRFYDAVIELSEPEREALRRLPYDEEAFLHLVRASAVSGEAGYTPMERIGVRPSADVNAIWSGEPAIGRAMIVPSAAYAELSFRLVPDQDPSETRRAVEEFFSTEVPPGVDCTIKWRGSGVRACHVDTKSAAFAALTTAISASFDSKPVLTTREGGSGPEAKIQDALQASLLFLGVGLPDDHTHAPNEKVSTAMLLRGAEAAAGLWDGLGQLGAVGVTSAGA
jgi:acetylornithine deacetylase/succinyl-diaminopimelate desuccinylase-like protein